MLLSVIAIGVSFAFAPLEQAVTVHEGIEFEHANDVCKMFYNNNATKFFNFGTDECDLPGESHLFL